MSFMPETYIGPHGGPLYWMNEETGVLAQAIYAYMAGQGRSMTDGQIELVKEYVLHWLKAPCWIYPDELQAAMDDLQRRIQIATTPHDIDTVWHAMMDKFAIDPF